MAKNSRDSMQELLDGAVCANECTGALQHISLDAEEVARIHDLFIGQSRRSDRKGDKR